MYKTAVGTMLAAAGYMIPEVHGANHGTWCKPWDSVTDPPPNRYLVPGISQGMHEYVSYRIRGPRSTDHAV